MSANIYNFKVKTAKNKNYDLNQVKGKVLLIVNTASKCGFTPQYEGLQKLYDDYKDRGLDVFGFPCNQFMNQEPGNADEIKNFCSLTYNVSFPIMAKVDVNGKDADPLFMFLKEQAPGLLGKRIKWNFTKFLIDKNGKVVRRFAPGTKPEKLARTIEKLL